MSAPCSALRPTFSRILLASDFSCRSLIAARYARLFAKLDGGLLWIAHAVTPSVSPDGVPVPVTDHAEQDMTQFVESEPLRDLFLHTVCRQYRRTLERSGECDRRTWDRLAGDRNARTQRAGETYARIDR